MAENLVKPNDARNFFSYDWTKVTVQLGEVLTRQRNPNLTQKQPHPNSGVDNQTLKINEVKLKFKSNAYDFDLKDNENK